MFLMFAFIVFMLCVYILQQLYLRYKPTIDNLVKAATIRLKITQPTATNTEITLATYMQCGICKDHIFTTDNLCVVASCAHIYHSACMADCDEEDDQCPHCQTSCSSETVTNIFMNLATDKPTPNTVQSMFDNLQSTFVEEQQTLVERETRTKTARLMREVLRKQIRELSKHIELVSATLKHSMEVVSIYILYDFMIYYILLLN